MYYGFILKNSDGSPIYGAQKEIRESSQYTSRRAAKEDAQARVESLNMKCPVIEIYTHPWCSDARTLVETLELKCVYAWEVTANKEGE